MTTPCLRLFSISALSPKIHRNSCCPLLITEARLRVSRPLLSCDAADALISEDEGHTHAVALPTAANPADTPEDDDAA